MASMDYDFFTCAFCNETVKAYHDEERGLERTLEDLALHLIQEHEAEFLQYMEKRFFSAEHPLAAIFKAAAEHEVGDES